jgi:hypothetical protein
MIRTAAFVALALFGCGASASYSGSGSSASGAAGSGSDAGSGASAGSASGGLGAVPDSSLISDVFALVTLTASPSAPGMCVGVGPYSLVETVMQVGEPSAVTSQEPTLVATGAIGVRFSCSVNPEGSSYAISLQVVEAVDVSGTGTASLTVSGVVNASTGGTNLTGDVSTSLPGDYHSATCTIGFSTPGAGASPQGPPIALGRIWAHLSCPAAQNLAITTASGGPSTCDVEADFIFENCDR